MKILNIKLPDELTSIFYLWCDIVNYPKVEDSFSMFINDALLYYGEEVYYIKIIDNTENHKDRGVKVRLAVDFGTGIYYILEVTSKDDVDISFFISKFEEYLNK